MSYKKVTGSIYLSSPGVELGSYIRAYVVNFKSRELFDSLVIKISQFSSFSAEQHCITYLK